MEIAGAHRQLHCVVGGTVCGSLQNTRGRAREVADGGDRYLLVARHAQGVVGAVLLAALEGVAVAVLRGVEGRLLRANYWRAVRAACLRAITIVSILLVCRLEVGRKLRRRSVR